jgi:hypothetical protein
VCHESFQSYGLNPNFIVPCLTDKRCFPCTPTSLNIPYIGK